LKVRPVTPAALLFLRLVRDLAPVSRRLGLRVFVVGGAVRDLAEGRVPAEWDLVVIGAGTGGARGLAFSLARRWRWREPVAFPRFGTYLAEGPAGRVEIADSSLRTRLALPGDDPLRKDALARDFTLNALYLDPSRPPEKDGRLDVLDPTGRGAADLGAGVLRTPIAASRTLADDPLRILRAARFAATRGYRATASLARAARTCAPLLRDVAVERAREELDRLLAGARPSAGLSLLARWGAFVPLLPEVHAMVGYPQENPHHFDDLFLHTIKAVDAAPPDSATRWAALLHDCGKPRCRSVTPQGCRFIGHEAVGGEMAAEALSRLRFSRRAAREIVSLVRLHMIHYQQEWSDAAVRRLAARAGVLLPKALDLLEADSRALKRRGLNTRGARALRKRVEEVMRRSPPPVSPLSGREIMGILGVGAGREVGEAKRELARAAEEGEIPGGREGARRHLLNWWKGRGGTPPPASPPSRRRRR
jgi:poly(A) polymerase